MIGWRRYAVDVRPLGVPAFRRLWAASAVVAVAGSFGLVAVPVLLYTVAGSSAAVGAAGGVSLVSLVVAALAGGAASDAVDRRVVLVVATAALAGSSALIWLSGVLGLHSVGTLLVLVAVQGVGVGAGTAVTGAVVPRLVPAEQLPAAQGLSSLVRQLGVVTGPLLGGALIPVVGLDALFGLDAAASLVVLRAVWRLPPLPPGAPRARDEPRPGTRRAGFGLLGAVLAIDLAAMVLGYPVAVLPQLAEQTFGGTRGGGPEAGLLFAAAPLGAFAVGLASGALTASPRPGAVLVLGAAGWGAALALAGLAPTLWTAAAALAVAGGCSFLLTTFRNAITQSQLDDAVLGRAQGVLAVVLFGGPQLGTLLHGLAAAAVGPRWAIGGGGAAAALAVVVVAVVCPAVWRLRRPPPAR